MTCSRSTPGNHSRKSLALAPASRFSNKARTGTRVPANTQAPPTRPGTRSTAAHAVQSHHRAPPCATPRRRVPAGCPRPPGTDPRPALRPRRGRGQEPHDHAHRHPQAADAGPPSHDVGIPGDPIQSGHVGSVLAPSTRPPRRSMACSTTCSYHERLVLDRPLHPDEVQHFTDTARRLATILRSRGNRGKIDSRRRPLAWPARCDGRAETGPPGNLRSRHREEDMTRKTSSRTRDVVQVKNPRSGHYVKIDRGAGKIVSHKKSPGPYKGVPVARKKKSR